MNLFDEQVGLVPALACMVASAVAGAVGHTLWWTRYMSKRKNLIEFFGGIYDTSPDALQEILNDLLTHKSIPIKGTPDDFILPGWFCLRCDVFNGEAKEARAECRVCELQYIRPDPSRCEPGRRDLEAPEIPVEPG